MPTALSQNASHRRSRRLSARIRSSEFGRYDARDSGPVAGALGGRESDQDNERQCRYSQDSHLSSIFSSELRSSEDRLSSNAADIMDYYYGQLPFAIGGRPTFLVLG